MAVCRCCEHMLTTKLDSNRHYGTQRMHPFWECISIPGYLNSSCSNCIWREESHSFKHCSYRADAAFWKENGWGAYEAMNPKARSARPPDLPTNVLPYGDLNKATPAGTEFIMSHKDLSWYCLRQHVALSKKDQQAAHSTLAGTFFAIPSQWVKNNTEIARQSISRPEEDQLEEEGWWLGRDGE